jgi:hypothetical protein
MKSWMSFYILTGGSDDFCPVNGHFVVCIAGQFDIDLPAELSHSVLIFVGIQLVFRFCNEVTWVK